MCGIADLALQGKHPSHDIHRGPRKAGNSEGGYLALLAFLWNITRLGMGMDQDQLSIF